MRAYASDTLAGLFQTLGLSLCPQPDPGERRQVSTEAEVQFHLGMAFYMLGKEIGPKTRSNAPSHSQGFLRKRGS